MKHANEQKALWKPISNPVRLLILCPQKSKLRVSYRKQKIQVCRGALSDESKAKYRPVSNISVPIQGTKDTWSDWYLETVNTLHDIENLPHMLHQPQ